MNRALLYLCVRNSGPNGENNRMSREPEGVRLLKQYKEDRKLTSREAAAKIGYDSVDSWHRICRYEYVPGPIPAKRIAAMIGKTRGWVLDHWASEVEARKAAFRKAVAS
jgi:hypothetical protein